MRFLKLMFAAFVVSILLATANLVAATLCVAPGGANGCFSRIADAVAAANPNDTVVVKAGTYAESILITKPISLSGDGATIDATGLSRGVFVNGYLAPGLSAVNIAGFKIKNANFEGILVLNATDVSISGNTVEGNDRSLTSMGCPGLDSFEPAEQADCGEGIHLLGTDHSIVTNNLVQNNSGGILLSDDTGPAHHNLISFNTVLNNAYACGIVLASHIQAAISPYTIPTGVFQNTIYGNKSKANGLANGGGAGIGIFASIPQARAYSNVVANNFIADNGLPGITIHGHTPNQSLNDNVLVGNTIVNNGADTEDAYTPGPTGINIYSVSPSAGNIVSGNSIQNESYDVAVKLPNLVQVKFNALLGLGVGVANFGAGTIDATENWWSCPKGPYLPGSCSAAVGTSVSVTPWLAVPPPGQPVY